ncbi:MAG: hypothetical protein PHU27_09155 [Salinivirgaceae bacterium]|nr:hypothetical protein [Salinivirgaceae bacterium]
MYRKIFILLFIFFSCVPHFAFGQCDHTLLENSLLNLEKYTYLQHFRIKSAHHSLNSTCAQFSVNLTKGITYVFTTENDRSEEGSAIVKLHDDFKYYSGNMAEDERLLPGFSFICGKSGIYYLTITFDNHGPGCAVVIMSMLNEQKPNRVNIDIIQNTM